MIVSWKDESGVTHWGDDKSKAYKRHLESKPAEVDKPAVVKPDAATPAVEVEAKRK
ncbi:hypothetical protein GV794_01930 [Nocardia cyriacigeorgica]|uniref:DUF4124 domain-containing protein n=1 Tax=Nocardia cyriacigeorgica TaxID=135487 RepID=A0ABX0CCY4_9NOCA|nr:hypothetical protein [Nocardia cyriacigeorgica]NEW40782.1 hypothetical protein [Nocardia cyriacigeorgica]NEW50992.1 hypothetical protein [Nocardia cyriacigeorgica]NEW54425.1 hypothetical protein [Nocardia cyriacigeorgica]